LITAWWLRCNVCHVADSVLKYCFADPCCVRFCAEMCGKMIYLHQNITYDRWSRKFVGPVPTYCSAIRLELHNPDLTLVMNSDLCLKFYTGYSLVTPALWTVYAIFLVFPPLFESGSHLTDEPCSDQFGQPQIECVV